MKLLSWNIYFDDQSGLKRYPEILSFLKHGDYDFICLQEVTASFLELLKNDSLHQNYYLSEIEENKRYQNLILSKYPLFFSKVIPLNSKLERVLNLVKINFPKSSLFLGTVHLESYPEDTQIRLLQLEEIQQTSKDFPNFILAGDFNFGDEEEENQLLNNFFTDTGLKNGEATFDIVKNKIASQSKFPNEKSRRLDRICTKGNILTRNFHKYELQSSDHFPVEITFEIN